MGSDLVEWGRSCSCHRGCTSCEVLQAEVRRLKDLIARMEEEPSGTHKPACPAHPARRWAICTCDGEART